MNIYSPAQNNIIKNNVFDAPAYTNEYCFLMNDGTNAIVFNNIFKGHQRICNTEYRSNLSTGNQYWEDIFSAEGSCTVENNISASVQYSSYPDNLINQDMNTVFVCWNDCTGFTSDDRYKLLQPTSPP